MALSNPKSISFTQQAAARFWSNVAVGPADTCWEWKRSRIGGYGQVKHRGKSYRASRVAYYLHTGDDPGPLLVCHTCDNPPCCNPAHLFKGTNLENLTDCKVKGRLNTAAGERHKSRTRPELVLRGESVGGAKLTEPQVREMISLYMTGRYTQDALAERYNVKRETVGLALRGKNWKHIPRDLAAIRTIAKQQQATIGERGNHKLTESDVRRIRELHAKGDITYAALGKVYDTTPENISFIVRRVHWKHVN